MARKRRLRAWIALGLVVVLAGVVLAIPGGPRVTALALIKYRECFTNPAPGDAANSTIGFGDSITVGRSNALVRLGASDSYFDVLGCDSGSGVAYVSNEGIKGNTTQQMLDRIEQDVIAASPERVLVLGGTNDVLRAPDLDTVKNLDEIKDRLEAAGIEPVFGLLPPNNLKPQETVTMNDKIRGWADREGVQLIDYWTPLAEPGGQYKPGMNQDDVHPSVEGAHVMADAAKQALAKL